MKNQEINDAGRGVGSGSAVISIWGRVKSKTIHLHILGWYQFEADRLSAMGFCLFETANLGFLLAMESTG